MSKSYLLFLISIGYSEPVIDYSMASQMISSSFNSNQNSQSVNFENVTMDNQSVSKNATFVNTNTGIKVTGKHIDITNATFQNRVNSKSVREISGNSGIEIEQKYTNRRR